MSIMLLTDELQRRLWARASTLDERLSGAFEPVPGDEQAAHERMAAWQHLVADGDPERMRRRLAYDGLDLAQVLPLLGEVAAGPDAALPPELAVIAQFVFEAQSPAWSPAAERGEPALAKLAFPEFHAPALRVGRRLLHERLGSDAARVLAAIGPKGLHGCERGLLERLAGACSQTLYAELERERSEGGEAGCHRRLVARLRGPELIAFLLDYAALARAVALIIAQWAETTAEFLLRFTADVEQLSRSFAGASGPVTALALALGDAHNGGRGVVRVEFADGVQIYYKPRALALDLALAALLDQLVELGAPYELRLPRVLARDGYGWVEGIEAREAANLDEVELFFERSGALLCIAYLLDITDCHSENLVACGPHPVLIDLETVCHHRARDLDERYSDAELRVRNRIAESVIGSGLLPAARREGETRVELGGISCGDDVEVMVEVMRWAELGSDRMRPEIEQRPRSASGHNLLRHAGRVVSVREWPDALRRGFERTYRFLQAQREHLLRPGGPLDAGSQVAACEARFVFRATLVYGALLRRVSDPALSHEGIDRSLIFEALGRAYLEHDEQPSIWPVLRAERIAMQQLDVPYFTSAVSDACLRIAGAPPIHGYLRGSGIARVQDRLRGFDERDLALQLGFIHSTMVRPLAAVAVEVGEHDAASELADIDDAALRDAALEIGELLWARLELGDDGSATWIDTRVDASIDAYVRRPIPLDLGEGVAGVLLFVAALERVCGAVFATRLRGAVLRHLELGLAQMAAQTIGGLTSAGSVAYALAKTAQLSGDASVLDLAARVVELISLQAIAVDVQLDVAGGVAGTLACLAAVREVAEEHGHAELAELCSARIRGCGERLSAVGEANEGVFPTVAGRGLTGMSHGHAGIALALARLRAEEGAAAVQGWIASSLAFERRHFDVHAGNWLDLRPSASSSCSCSWCHGAPGIGVARAALLEVIPNDGIMREELLVAAATTAREPLSPIDHLCCGNMGRAHALALMAEALGDAQLRARARGIAAQVIARAKRDGGYRTLVGDDLAEQGLGLFTGLAGVGYACLHLCDASLPSPLALS